MNEILTLIIDDEPLIRERISSLLKANKRFKIIGESADGLVGYKAIRKLSPDLVFLDIKMPGLTGLEVAAKLPAEKMPVIVFVTAYSEFSIKAFEVHAVDYILKPIEKERFNNLLDHLQSIFDQKKNAEMGARINDFLASETILTSPRINRLSIKKNGKIILLNTEEVDLISANGNSLKIYSKGIVHDYKGTISAIENQLDKLNFIRVHRSHIININFISEMEHMYKGEYSIRLQNGTKLTSSRNYKINLDRILNTSL